MSNFNQNNRFGGGRDFNRRSYGDRGSDRPPMFDAVCAQCGKDCQVPFRPSGTKPVLCNNCFRGQGQDSRRPEGRNQERPRFERNDQRPRTPDQPDYKKKFDELNIKVDKILRIVSALQNPQKEEMKPVIDAITIEQPKAKTKKKKVAKKAPATKVLATEV